MKITLVGPPDATFSFTTHAGVRHEVRNGVVTPDIAREDVPSNLWGLGFVIQEQKPATKSRKPVDSDE